MTLQPLEELADRLDPIEVSISTTPATGQVSLAATEAVHIEVIEK